jgi:hypothetical protein
VQEGGGTNDGEAWSCIDEGGRRKEGGKRTKGGGELIAAGGSKRMNRQCRCKTCREL